MNKVSKFGLYVKTTKKNYLFELLFSLIYFIISLIFALKGSYILIFFSLLSTLFFYRFIEYQFTGITIRVVYFYETGTFAKALAYMSLVVSLFLLGMLIFL